MGGPFDNSSRAFGAHGYRLPGRLHVRRWAAKSGSEGRSSMKPETVSGDRFSARRIQLIVPWAGWKPAPQQRNGSFVGQASCLPFSIVPAERASPRSRTPSKPRRKHASLGVPGLTICPIKLPALRSVPLIVTPGTGALGTHSRGPFITMSPRFPGDRLSFDTTLWWVVRSTTRHVRAVPSGTAFRVGCSRDAGPPEAAQKAGAERTRDRSSGNEQ